MSIKTPAVFISPAVKELGLFAEFAVIQYVVNHKSNPEFESIKHKLFKSLHAEYSGLSFEEDPVLQGYRNVRSKLQTSGNKCPPSPEKLINLFIKREELSAINLLVDICNCISLQTRLSIGVHRLDKVGVQICFDLTKGDESFIALGSSKASKIAAGEFAYIDSKNNILCRFDSVQCDMTKVTEETTATIIIVQGNANTSLQYVNHALDQMTSLIKQFCGGEDFRLSVLS